VVPQGAVDAAIDTSYPVAGGGEGFLGCWNMHPHQPHKGALEVGVGGAVLHGGCRPSFRELKNQFTQGWGWGADADADDAKACKVMLGDCHG
jgi:hypothetical protein